MLYIGWMAILCGHDIKKNKAKTSKFELSKVGNCVSTLCTTPFTLVSHYWWKQSFRIFGTCFDRASANLENAKYVILYPTKYELS